MWYHYILLLIGLYLVGSSIYNLAMAGNRSGWIVNGISTAIGFGLAYWAWTAINAPVAPYGMAGGRRR